MRITESDLHDETLRFARDRGGFISTSDLIDALTAAFAPQGKDADILKGRNDTYFSQKVRNMVSHREVQGSIFARGLADYVQGRHGIQINASGLAYLKGKGI